MCIAFFLWEHPSLPELPLVALFNRDEVLHRPTAASHFWEDRPGILGGRDLVAGGTWMCINTRSGRAAFLTNFRELRDTQRMAAPSRGALPVDFVTAEEDPEQFLSSLDSKAYPGFNLIAADLAGRRMLYLCNKHDGQRGRLEPVAPGLHGVTNGHMEAHWPKVQDGCRRLQELLDSSAFEANSSEGRGGSEGSSDGSSGGSSSSGGSGSGGSKVPWEQLFNILSDDQLLEQDPQRLPMTGYGPEFEAKVSGIFVQPVDTQWGLFGTRSQTVLAVWRDGRAELRERYLTGDGSWHIVQHSFGLPAVPAAANDSSGADAGEASNGDGAECSLEQQQQQQQQQACAGHRAVAAQVQEGREDDKNEDESHDSRPPAQLPAQGLQAARVHSDSAA